MIEPPSQSLATALEELRLCSQADLRACRPRVKRLAHDLPAFDSVWIDALVQAHKLTSFQADMLQFRDPRRLRVGPYVLEDQLGTASPESPTYLARHPGSSQQCVLKILDDATQPLEPGLSHLQTLVKQGEKLRSPTVVVPHACRVDGRRLVLVSRYVTGQDLTEWVVRRGRFQPAIVAAIARQLIAGLWALEQCGLVHGEVRVQKVRLTPRGQAVLVDAGIRQAHGGGRLIHLGHKPEQCDGIAPEIAESGQAANIASDVYALGCLLWQLLAGRPVFPRGDPLAKLAAHRTCVVPDIREWAPDVPSAMAELLQGMTAKDSALRPQSFAELQQAWGRGRARDCRLLSRSLNGFHSHPGGRAVKSRLPLKWSLVAALLLSVSGAAFRLADQGALGSVLNITSDWVAPLLTKSSASASAPDSEGILAPDSDSGPQKLPLDTQRARPSDAFDGISQPRPLPIPSADGLLELESGQVYRAARITSDATMIVRCSGAEPARIVVGAQGLRLEAPRVAIQNVEFRMDRQSLSAPGQESTDTTAGGRISSAAALLLVRSDELSLSACRFEVVGNRGATGASVIGLAWKPATNIGSRQQEVWVEDCLFHGLRIATHLNQIPRHLQFTNCLVVDAGLVCSLPAGGPTEAEVVCQQVTVRQTLAVIGLRPVASPVSSRPVAVRITQSVVDLAPQGALLWVPESLSAARERPLLAINGDAVLVSSHVSEARVGSGNAARTGAPGLLAVEGIAASDVQFAGPADADPRHARLQEFEPPPRVSAADELRAAPGIDVQVLATALKLQNPQP